MASTSERPIYVYILGLTALLLFGANMAMMLERELQPDQHTAGSTAVEAPVSVETPTPPPPPVVVDIEKVRVEVERVRTEVERIRTEHNVRKRKVAPSIVILR